MENGGRRRRLLGVLTRRRLTVAGGVAAFALAIVVVSWVVYGDFFEDFGDLTGWATRLVQRFGMPGAYALLYLEESGIPLPVPGDAYVVYIGNASAARWTHYIPAWLGVVLAVTAGASNLYLVSRRWGHRLVEHRLAPLLHLDAERFARAEAWFDRYGPWALIFGRHLPGFRVPLTVLAGVFEVPYPVFAASIAVSASIWAAFWMYLGARYGFEAVGLVHRHPALVAVAAGVVILLVVGLAVRAWRSVPPSTADDSDAGAALAARRRRR